jgi:hypothetical protein
MKLREKLKGMNEGMEELISAGYCNSKVHPRTGHKCPEVE